MPAASAIPYTCIQMFLKIRSTTPSQRTPFHPASMGLALLCAAAAAMAGPTPEPVQAGALAALPASSRVVLQAGAQGKERAFTLAQIEAAGMHRVTTSTYWPSDDGTYEGPLLRDVLAAAGLAGAAQVQVVARDGFTQTIPREDWTRWPVMVATRKNGSPWACATRGRCASSIRATWPRPCTTHSTGCAGCG